MTEPTLKDKVEELIGENPVLLFMKGTPEAPQLRLLDAGRRSARALGVEYAALDVLPALEPLREATGEISDWRTFPQLYVKGELVGGADIVEEMHASGELGRDARRRAAGRGRRRAEQQLAAGPAQSPPMQIDNS